MAMDGEIVEKRASCSVEWKIKDFSPSLNFLDTICSSPSFHLSDALWCLELHSIGLSKYMGIGIYLRKKNSLDKDHKVLYRLGMKASDGTEIKSQTGAHVFNVSVSLKGFYNLCEGHELLPRKRKLSPDRTLTIFCQACVVGEKNGLDAETQTDSRDDLYGLSKNFKNLFLNEESADVTIKVQGREFRAHSQILSARSPVLAAMFSHDTKEKNTGIVEIQEYDPDAFKEFLLFLYSGQAEDLSLENVTVLYSAADKYDIENLKTRCSAFMRNNMSVDSFCRFHHLAITYDDKDLTEISSNFFVENMKKIIATSQWISFVEQHPVKSNELHMRTAERFYPD